MTHFITRTINPGIKSTFNTVADLKAAGSLKSGDMVLTRGYYSAADGGGELYQIAAGEAVDGNVNLNMPSGLRAINKDASFGAAVRRWRAMAAPYLGSLPDNTYNGTMPLPYPVQDYLNVYKSGDSYSYSLKENAFLGSSPLTLFVSAYGSNDIEAGGSWRSPVTWSGVQAKATAGQFDSVSYVELLVMDDVCWQDDSLADFSAVFTSARLWVRSIAPSGRTLLTSSKSPTSMNWALVDDVFEARINEELAQVFCWMEKDSHGMPRMYKQVSDLAELGVGMWFHDIAAGKLYVRPFQLVTDVHKGFVVTPRNGTWFKPGELAKKALFTDIAFATNGVDVRTVSKNNPTIFQRCTFVAGKHDAFAYSSATGFVIMLECLAAWSGKDGFNYHAYNMAANFDSIAMEVNCVAYNAGLYKYTGGNTTTHSNNGSTAHDGMTVFRYGCSYWDCEGPVLADVNGCYSVNYGIDVGDVLNSTTGQKSAFYCVGGKIDGIRPSITVAVGVTASGKNLEEPFYVTTEKFVFDDLKGSKIDNTMVSNPEVMR